MMAFCVLLCGMRKLSWLRKGTLKVGQAIRLLHGYTRQDRSGKVELHLGGKSKIEIDPEEKADEYPAIGKFATSIALLNPNLRSSPS